ncbi:nuclear transport factor 2 family protein [Paraburkholderia youngii]|uniref:Putative SnoaL-like aldol condensation-catalyzing enzyme n=1 Tax=Paraburkholderia youngii TaxID=2782701 RepID=A0A7W8LCE1_9BURK|nr:putative SnoaL-like aldol condensation-catalyzing enzyme [Paraburkholderia youngii]
MYRSFHDTRDGKEGFRQFVAAFKQKHRQSHSSIVRVFADGDYVILYVQARRPADGAGRAVLTQMVRAIKEVVA